MNHILTFLGSLKVEQWLHGGESRPPARLSFPLTLNNGYVERLGVFLRKTKNRVRTDTFKELRTLCSIVGPSHCFSTNSRAQTLIWNKFNSRKQQAAAIVTHLHKRTFPPSYQDDVKCQHKRHKKQFGRVFTFLHHGYNGNILISFIPGNSSLSVC